LFKTTNSNADCNKIKSIGLFSDEDGNDSFGTSVQDGEDFNLEFSLANPINGLTKYIIATPEIGSPVRKEVKVNVCPGVLKSRPEHKLYEDSVEAG